MSNAILFVIKAEIMKKIISGVIGTIIMANTLVPISVNARVIEPEIVKTETWTTSYYIDDDIETLYPYIELHMKNVRLIFRLFLILSGN